MAKWQGVLTWKGTGSDILLEHVVFWLNYVSNSLLSLKLKYILLGLVKRAYTQHMVCTINPKTAWAMWIFSMHSFGLFVWTKFYISSCFLSAKTLVVLQSNNLAQQMKAHLRNPPADDWCCEQLWVISVVLWEVNQRVPLEKHWTAAPGQTPALWHDTFLISLCKMPCKALQVPSPPTRWLIPATYEVMHRWALHTVSLQKHSNAVTTKPECICVHLYVSYRGLHLRGSA